MFFENLFHWLLTKTCRNSTPTGQGYHKGRLSHLCRICSGYLEIKSMMLATWYLVVTIVRWHWPYRMAQWQEMVAEVLQLQCRRGLKRRWRGGRRQEVYVSMMHLLADAWNGRRIWNRVVCLNKGLQWQPEGRERGGAAASELDWDQHVQCVCVLVPSISEA